MQQQHPNAAHQQQQVVGSHGPFDATLAKSKCRRVLITALAHEGKLNLCMAIQHTEALQERVSRVLGLPAVYFACVMVHCWQHALLLSIQSCVAPDQTAKQALM
jgi:hypothetical protein